MKKLLIAPFLISSIFAIDSLVTAKLSKDLNTAFVKDIEYKINLEKGWNLVGLAGYKAYSLNDLFGNSDLVNKIFVYDSKTEIWQSFKPNDLKSSIKMILPTMSYWIDAKVPFTVAFKSNIPSNREVYEKAGVYITAEDKAVPITVNPISGYNNIFDENSSVKDSLLEDMGVMDWDSLDTSSYNSDEWSNNIVFNIDFFDGVEYTDDFGIKYQFTLRDAKEGKALAINGDITIDGSFGINNRGALEIRPPKENTTDSNVLHFKLLKILDSEDEFKLTIKNVELNKTSIWRLSSIYNKKEQIWSSQNHFFDKNSSIENLDSITWDSDLSQIVEHVDNIKSENNISKSLPSSINFKSLSGGSFIMGGGNIDSDSPEVSVTLSPFEISEKEITNEQYIEFLNASFSDGWIRVEKQNIADPCGISSENVVVGADKSPNEGEIFIQLAESGGCTSSGEAESIENRSYISFNSDTNLFELLDSTKASYPVNWIKWYGAYAFAKYYEISLPTEAQWEYSAKGGENLNYATSDGELSSEKANYNGDLPNIHNPDGYSFETGSYAPNPFGLYDMSGNLWEWCLDYYSDSFYSDGATNPVNEIALNEEKRVLRGGSWNYHATTLLTYARKSDLPSRGNNHFGFRVVRNK